MPYFRTDLKRLASCPGAWLGLHINGYLLGRARLGSVNPNGDNGARAVVVALRNSSPINTRKTRAILADAVFSVPWKSHQQQHVEKVGVARVSVSQGVTLRPSDANLVASENIHQSG
jgi:hypothetical protein